MMRYLQRLGKALMLPVACLPICGILMGLGYALCPSTMQGGEVVGFLQMLGFFFVKAGGALIDNMALLFVIGVGVGMSDDNDGTAALAGLVSWLTITTLLSTGSVTTLMPSVATIYRIMPVRNMAACSPSCSTASMSSSTPTITASSSPAFLARPAQPTDEDRCPLSVFGLLPIHPISRPVT